MPLARRQVGTGRTALVAAVRQALVVDLCSVSAAALLRRHCAAQRTLRATSTAIFDVSM
jgi:hypothetical protein